MITFLASRWAAFRRETRHVWRDRYKNTCLVDCLRAMGLKVAYESDGPFWVLGDGKRMGTYSAINPPVSGEQTTKMCIALSTQCSDKVNTPRYTILPVIKAATPGRYILYKNQPFNGLRIYSDGECAVTTTHRS